MRRREAERRSASGAAAPQESVSAVPKFGQMVERKIVRVFHQRYSETGLTTEQIKSVQKAIIQNIMDLEENSIKPKFPGTTLKRVGWSSAAQMTKRQIE